MGVQLLGLRLMCAVCFQLLLLGACGASPDSSSFVLDAGSTLQTRSARSSESVDTSTVRELTAHWVDPVMNEKDYAKHSDAMMRLVYGTSDPSPFRTVLGSATAEQDLPDLPTARRQQADPGRSGMQAGLHLLNLTEVEANAGAGVAAQEQAAVIAMTLVQVCQYVLSLQVAQFFQQQLLSAWCMTALRAHALGVHDAPEQEKKDQEQAQGRVHKNGEALVIRSSEPFTRNFVARKESASREVTVSTSPEILIRATVSGRHGHGENALLVYDFRVLVPMSIRVFASHTERLSSIEYCAPLNVFNVAGHLLDTFLLQRCVYAARSFVEKSVRGYVGPSLVHVRCRDAQPCTVQSKKRVKRCTAWLQSRKALRVRAPVFVGRVRRDTSLYIVWNKCPFLFQNPHVFIFLFYFFAL